MPLRSMTSGKIHISKVVKSAIIIFLPVVLMTSFFLMTPPSYVKGLTFRVDISQNINETELERMNLTLNVNGYDAEYPGTDPFEYPETHSYDVLLIHDNCSEIYIIGGNNSHFFGVWCYKIHVLSGEGNVAVEKERILNEISRISQILSINYSEDSIAIDDNDFELFPYQLQFFAYSICIAYTISAAFLYLWKGYDIWKSIWNRWDASIGFAFMIFGLIPVWSLIRLILSGAIMGAEPMFYVCLIIFISFFIASVYIFKGIEMRVEE